MNTSPSIDDLLAGVIQALGDDVLPQLADPKAQATTAMARALLQTVRQVLPVYDQYLVEEHNDMIGVLADVAGALAGVDAEAARRITALAAAEADRDEFPAPPDRDALIAGHRALTTALGDVVRDLDELQRAGIAEADDALTVLRSHLGPRYLRDAATVTVEGGLIGRG